MKPAARKRIVTYPVDQGASERRACRLIGVSRTAMRYQAHRAGETELRSRLLELARDYPRYGYLMLHSLLKTEKLVVNPKRTYRLYCEEGLQVRTKRRKKLVRPRIPMTMSTMTIMAIRLVVWAF